ncbi:MAG: hypothetical protein Q9183_006402 [Haloplaca sp. 2 TL-2023]
MKHMTLELDDYLAIAAMAVVFGNYICQILTLQQGLGKHVDMDSAAEQLGPFMRLTFATEILYVWIHVFSKLSILRLYKRIFGTRAGINKTFVHTVYGVSVLVVLWGLSMIVTLTIQCKPLGAAWDPTKSHKRCLDLHPFFLSTNILNIALDIVIIALPMFPLWRIKVTVAKRVGLTFVFLLSAIATIMSCLRLHAVHSVVFDDPTWNLVPVAIWSTVESTVGVVCCCLPVLAPVVTWTCDKVKPLVTKTRRRMSNRRRHRQPSPDRANHLMAVSNNPSGVTLGVAEEEIELSDMLAMGPTEV